MGKDVTALVELLNRSSTPYTDPLARIDWEALELDAWWLPEQAISLFGLPQYQALPEARRKLLSRLEFINFIEKALWLEGIFMERISRALSDSLGDPAATTYRLHELREEAGHSLMFMELIRRSGMEITPGMFHRPRLATWVGRFAPSDSAAFWIAVLIGEQVPDRMNRFIRKHRREISPAVYQIITLHAIDEARHIAHARETVENRVHTGWKWLGRLYPALLNRIFSQFVLAFYFPCARLYEAAGLEDGRKWRRMALANPHRIAFVDLCVSDTLTQLGNHGLHIGWRKNASAPGSPAA